MDHEEKKSESDATKKEDEEMQEVQSVEKNQENESPQKKGGSEEEVEDEEDIEPIPKHEFGPLYGGFPPDTMTPHESRYLLQYRNSTTYLKVRNHLLSLWHRNPQLYLSFEDASKGVKEEHLGKVRTTWTYLNQWGYINFGFHEIPPEIENNPTYKRMQETNGRTKVVIVGAGMAGLTAAHHLKRWGYRVVLLEGRDRFGGRVWSFPFAGATVDLGASVVTGAVGNPISPLFHQLSTRQSHLRVSCPLYSADGTLVSDEADKIAEEKFNDFLNQTREDEVVDRYQSLGLALDMLMDEEEEMSGLERQLVRWHRANLEYGCAADLEHVSLRHWDQDDMFAFSGPHCLLPDGYGSIAKKFAEGVDIRYRHNVTKMEYEGDRVRAFCEDGKVISGDIALVTVPLQVLKKKKIKFEPPLPSWKNSAIDRLGAGLLNKVVLAFDEIFWVDRDYFGVLHEDPSLRGHHFIFWNLFRCTGKPILIALMAGKSAHQVEKEDQNEVVATVMGALKKMFPSCPEKPTESLVTAWGKDPFAGMSYSFISVESTGNDYDLLQKEVTPRLRFAGEATCRIYPATVPGAVKSGMVAAAQIDTFCNSEKKISRSGDWKDMKVSLGKVLKESDPLGILNLGKETQLSATEIKTASGSSEQKENQQDGETLSESGSGNLNESNGGGGGGGGSIFSSSSTPSFSLVDLPPPPMGIVLGLRKYIGNVKRPSGVESDARLTNGSNYHQQHPPPPPQQSQVGYPHPFSAGPNIPPPPSQFQSSQFQQPPPHQASSNQFQPSHPQQQQQQQQQFPSNQSHQQISGQNPPQNYNQFGVLQPFQNQSQTQTVPSFQQPPQNFAHQNFPPPGQSQPQLQSQSQPGHFAGQSIQPATQPPQVSWNPISVGSSNMLDSDLKLSSKKSPSRSSHVCKFEKRVSKVVVHQLTKFLKKGVIANKEDFKVLGRRLTKMILVKELKVQGKKKEDLTFSVTTEDKTKKFVNDVFRKIKPGEVYVVPHRNGKEKKEESQIQSDGGEASGADISGSSDLSFSLDTSTETSFSAPPPQTSPSASLSPPPPPPSPDSPPPSAPPPTVIGNTPFPNSGSAPPVGPPTTQPFSAAHAGAFPPGSHPGPPFGSSSHGGPPFPPPGTFPGHQQPPHTHPFPLPPPQYPHPHQHPHHVHQPPHQYPHHVPQPPHLHHPPHHHQHPHPHQLPPHFPHPHSHPSFHHPQPPHLHPRLAHQLSTNQPTPPHPQAPPAPSTHQANNTPNHGEPESASNQATSKPSLEEALEEEDEEEMMMDEEGNSDVVLNPPPPLSSLASSSPPPPPKPSPPPPPPPESSSSPQPEPSPNLPPWLSAKDPDPLPPWLQ